MSSNIVQFLVGVALIIVLVAVSVLAAIVPALLMRIEETEEGEDSIKW